MDASKELQIAMRAVLEGGFKSQREYDNAVTNLRYLCIQEHRRITTSPNGVRCSNEFGDLCRNFVMDTYFGGEWPHTMDVGMRRLARRLSSAVASYLRKACNVSGKTPMYADELSEIRIRAMDSKAVCAAIEKGLTSKTRDMLRDLRSG